MKYSIDNKNINMIRMYKKEYEDFQLALHREGCCDNLWKELDYLNEKSP